MKVKKMLVTICPKCREFYAIEDQGGYAICDECRTPMLIVPVEYSAYRAMTKEQQEEFKQQYARLHFKTAAKDGGLPLAEDVPPPRPFYIERNCSGWASFMTCGSWLGAVVCTIAAIGTLITGKIAAAFGVFFGGMLTVGVLGLLARIAEEVNETRNQVEKLRHDIGYKE